MSLEAIRERLEDARRCLAALGCECTHPAYGACLRCRALGDVRAALARLNTETGEQS